MARIRRRGYPAEPTDEQRDRKYGKRGNARTTKRDSRKEKKGR